VIAVRGAHELAQWSDLKAMLAHRVCDRLVIDDLALGVKLTSDAAVPSRGDSTHSASTRSRRIFFFAALRRLW
jgi:hypothetical protein